ncbi:FtsX-like permease family protein [Rheinheimera sp.]|uniref:ABC transporter permease n=1 Tax=Rheinheimera sp. TaxID=1869214 RepID=UPI00307E41DE
MWAKLAWRLFWRELKRGELWVIAFALFLAVLTVVSLSGITESVRAALYQRSANFVAADKILRSSVGFNADVQQKADALGLKAAQQLQFNSMVFAGENMQLTAIKAVSDSYPLRGTLELGTRVQQVKPGLKPTSGQVFVEERLLNLLQLVPGDSIELGESRLQVAGIIINEPDAPLSVFGGQPRLLMHIDDVPATQVIQPGSRISYRQMYAGDGDRLQQLEEQSKDLLGPQDRWQTMDRQSAVGGAVDRAERFLLLAGLLGIVLAACAAAVAASRYSQRHARAVAVMKALGASATLTRKLYSSHLALVTIFSVFLGLLLGQLAVELSQFGIRFYLPDYEARFSWRPLGLGTLTALICALLFSARPLWRLAAVPALNVLRQQHEGMKLDPIHLASGAAAIWGLMWLFSGDLFLSTALFALCTLFAALLMGFAALMMKIAKPMAAGQSSALKLALANLRRRLWPNAFQLITFTLALFLTLLLYFLRSELLDQWQRQVPEGAPNQFLVNLTAQDRAELEPIATTENLTLTGFYPMVPGRVLAVNGELFRDEATKEAPERREGVGRELNLTWVSELPDNNRISQGQWFNENSRAEVSVESELAQRLLLKLGDTLQFSIGGQLFDAKVSSIRTVDWNSLQPNFYMILSPDLMQNFPATYITAFYLPAERTELLNQLARQFPTVSVISVDAILKQVNDIINQVSVALSFILILVVAAATLVLVAQVQATLEQREQELATLRTLGASSVFLRSALLLEFAALGALAGLFATLLAEVLLAVVQQRFFELSYSPNWTLWWLGPVAGIGLVTVLGAWQLRGLLSLPGSLLLRRALQS